MFFYRINNFLNYGTPDYKGLDLKKNKGQVYGDDFAVMVNSEDVNHVDLEKITEEEYLLLRAELQPSEEVGIDRLTELENALMEMTMMQAVKDAENEQALMELTMMIGGI